MDEMAHAASDAGCAAAVEARIEEIHFDLPQAHVVPKNGQTCTDSRACTESCGILDLNRVLNEGR